MLGLPNNNHRKENFGSNLCSICVIFWPINRQVIVKVGTAVSQPGVSDNS